MNDQKRPIYEQYYPYLLFAIALVVANWLWKVSIAGEEYYGAIVTFLGIDVSYYFDLATRHLSECVYRIVRLFEPSVHFRGNTHLVFDNGNGMYILWSCTPIKQSFIWLCVMLIASRQSWHKCWYIPLGWGVLYGVNVLRISALTLLVHHHRNLFSLMHDYVLKYAFYLVLFLLYVFYVYFSDKWQQTRNCHIN